MDEIHPDATADCDCGLPMFPGSHAPGGVRFECANRHQRVLPLPDETRLRRRIANWIDRRSGQLDEQHRRWEREGRGDA